MTVRMVTQQYTRRRHTLPMMARTVRWEEVDRRRERATIGCFATIFLVGLTSITAPFAAVGWGWV